MSAVLRMMELTGRLDRTARSIWARMPPRLRRFAPLAALPLLLVWPLLLVAGFVFIRLDRPTRRDDGVRVERGRAARARARMTRQRRDVIDVDEL